MDPIAARRITAPELIRPSRMGSPGGEEDSFKDLLADAVEKVRTVQAESGQELKRLLAGETVDLHRVMLAGERAALAFQLMISVRNKVVDAYQEVMRIQV